MARTEQNEDAEANYFAMCLLMPATFVHAECDKMLARGLWDEDGIRLLAKTFAVSDVAMTLRLVQLGRITSP